MQLCLRHHLGQWHTNLQVVVYWLWEITHVQEVMGSNPSTIYWMDMTFLQIDLLLKLYCIV